MKKSVFNPAPVHTTPIPKSGLLGKKYSNYDGTEICPTMPDGSFTYNSGSGSGSFDWGGLVSQLLSSGTSIVKSIWGKDNSSQIQAYQYINEEQKKTTTILWVVIALMLALGVFIVIKKTK